MKLSKFPRILATCIAALVGIAAQAEDQFPSKPLTLIVPFAPGGNNDIIARALSIPLASILKHPVVVDNRPGGGSAIGANLVARAHKDGYTVMLTATSTAATLPLMIKTSYTAKDLAPVALVAKTSVILVTKAADPRFKSFAELQKTVSTSSVPLSGGHPAVGSPNHLALLQLEDALKTRFTVVPYKGSGPGLVDVMAGHVDLYFDQVSSSMQHINGGNLRALAVFGPTADPALPGVKTMAELGFPGIDATTYSGIFAPTGTPPAVMKALEEAVVRATQDPTFITALKDVGSVAAGAPGSEFARYIDAEAKLANQLIKEGRLQPE